MDDAKTWTLIHAERSAMADTLHEGDGHQRLRFNTMVDRGARRAATLPPTEIVRQLQATAATTSHPPAPVMAMLGEIVVHGEDIRHPLGVASEPEPESLASCLEMYSKARFPVGAKKRIAGLRVIASDADWTHGTGPEVSGPGLSLLLAICGRSAGLEGLSGEGVSTLRSRMAPAGQIRSPVRTWPSLRRSDQIQVGRSPD